MENQQKKDKTLFNNAKKFPMMNPVTIVGFEIN